MEHLRVNLSKVLTCECGGLLVSKKDDKFHLVMKICSKCSDQYIQMDRNYMKMAKARNKDRTIHQKNTFDKEEVQQEKNMCKKCYTSIVYLNGYCWECYKIEMNA